MVPERARIALPCRRPLVRSDHRSSANFEGKAQKLRFTSRPCTTVSVRRVSGGGPLWLATPSMDWTPLDILLIAVIGLAGGMLGGLLGLGGSVLIIPALTFSFGPNQHLYQAAALIVNIFVAVAATVRHRGKGTIRRDIAPTLCFAAGAAAIAGVLASNLVAPGPLMALFGLFLVVSSAAETISLFSRRPERQAPEEPSPCSKPLAAAIGTAGGLASGLLGIGGGLIIVPLLRRFAGVPIRQAVATSAVGIIAACAVGAVVKNASIPSLPDPSGEPLTLKASLVLALLLAPLATTGGSLGAALVYRVPVRALRIAFALLLTVAGTRMILSGIALGA